MADVISVSDLNHYVKTLLDVNDGLFDLALRGEIANFVQNARSGHCYFSLRDDACSVKAVMFRTDARRLAFRPEEGMRVVVRCRATLYERDGAFHSEIPVEICFPAVRQHRNAADLSFPLNTEFRDNADVKIEILLQTSLQDPCEHGPIG